MSIHYDFLLFRLSKSVAWRRSLVAKYRDDNRLLVAAEKLAEITATPEDQVDPELVARLIPFLAAQRRAGDIISQAARMVGFSRHPKTANDFGELLLATFVEDAATAPAPALANGLPAVVFAR